jgi:hypothetical protein
MIVNIKKQEITCVSLRPAGAPPLNYEEGKTSTARLEPYLEATLEEITNLIIPQQTLPGCTKAKGYTPSSHTHTTCLK